MISDGRRFVESGQNTAKSQVTDIELRYLVEQGRIAMPRAAQDIPALPLPGVHARINARAGLRSGKKGNFADGVIGGTALERGMTLVTRDKELLKSVRAAGGRAVTP